MPYISKEDRDLAARSDFKPIDVGTLNYLITKLITSYLTVVGRSYGTYNAALGVLECAKQELYRRMVAPHEDLKKQQNGDVYPA